MFETIFVLTSAAVVRRRALLDAGLFDEALAVAEDNDLFLRIITQGPVAAIEERLVRYRRHAASISRDEVANNASHRLLWQRIAQNPGRYPPGALEFVRRERVRRSRIAGEFAARRGRFGDARRELADSLHAGFSARAAVWYAASAACEIALRGRSRAAIIRGAPFQ